MAELDEAYLLEIDILQNLNCQGHASISLSRMAESHAFDVGNIAEIDVACEQIKMALKPHFPRVDFVVKDGYVRFVNALHPITKQIAN